MTVYLTSDLHFSHKNILEYCSRPFHTIEHMNESLIMNWNDIVHLEDEVYILGDFAMGNRSLIPEYLSKLKGRKHLVYGNHDKLDTCIGYFDSVSEWVILQTKMGPALCIHKPEDAVALLRDRKYLRKTIKLVLNGHVHTDWKIADLYKTEEGISIPFYNVGVDVNNYKPITIQSIGLNLISYLGQMDNKNE